MNTPSEGQPAHLEFYVPEWEQIEANPHIVQMALEVHIGGNYSGTNINLEKALKRVKSWFNNPDVFILAGRLGTMPVCFFVGERFVHWWSDDLFIKDIFSLVAPDLRNQGIAQTMNRAFLDWGRRSGATHVKLESSTGVETEASRKIYENLDLEPHSITYKGKL